MRERAENMSVFRPPEPVLRQREQLRGALVGGEWRHGTGAPYTHVYAANESVRYTVALASKEDMGEAVATAGRAAVAWRRSAPSVKAELLYKLAELIQAEGDSLASLQTLDTGFPIAGSLQLIPMMLDWTRYYAGWCDKIEGGSIVQAPGGRWIVNREPYGIVGIFLTWNMPISSVCMKAIAALAAGNCVVIKTPEMAPFGMMRFAELVERAGFPSGVISILPGGPEAGQALASDPRVGKLSFTGGTGTAAKIVAASAENVVPTLLELGGKSACTLFADADLDSAVPFAASFAIAASGQACIVPSRLLVQSSIYDEVVARVLRLFEGFRLGDPFDRSTTFGPVISIAARDRINGIVETSVREKAGRVIKGGGIPGGAFGAGAYFEPTLITDVSPQSSLFQNEIFGPVLCISRFTDEAEAVALANGTRYGLYAYLFTRDISRAFRVADQLEAGSVAINGFTGLAPRAPFGGFGFSGHGKEGGREGLDEFLRSKTLFIAD